MPGLRRGRDEHGDEEVVVEVDGVLKEQNGGEGRGKRWRGKQH